MKPFFIHKGSSKLPIVLSCEHASNVIPKEFNNLGWTNKEFSKCEDVLDKGAEQLFDFLCKKLNCRGIKSTFSRLVIDVNRNLNQPELIRKQCGKIPIPSNLELTKKQREKRIKTLYLPYRDNLHKLLDQCEKKHDIVLYYAIHTMAHHYEGRTRKMDLAIIYKAGEPVARMLGKELEDMGLNITYNDPYTLEEEVIRPTTDLKVCRFNKHAVVIEMNDKHRNDLKMKEALFTAILSATKKFLMKK